MECKCTIDIGNNMGNWKNLIITQTVPEPHTWKTQHQGTTKISHIGHCTHTLGSTDVQVQNVFNMRNNITHSTNCKYTRSATLYTLET